MEYEITANPFPVAIFQLQRGESIYCEAGGMSWMTEGFKLETEAGGIGRAFSRAFSGERMFVNKYTAKKEECEIAISSKYMGTIKAIELEPSRSFICQKGAILAYTTGVDRKISFHRPLQGLFGGEGFIMQEVFGQGLCFIEIDGEVMEYHLDVGEKLILDTGYLLMMDATCTMDIEKVGGFKNTIFGGEGFFNTTVTGPGRVFVQTSPIYKLARTLSPFFRSGE